MRTLTSLFVGLGLAILVAASQVPPAPKSEPPVKDEAKKDDARQESAKKAPADELKEIQAAFVKSQREFSVAYAKAKDDTERQQLLDALNQSSTELARRSLKVAEGNPDDPVAADLLLLAMSRGRDLKLRAQADQLLADSLIAQADLETIHRKIGRANLYGAGKSLDALVKRVEQDLAHARAMDLLTVVANQASQSPAGQRAGELVVAKFIDHERMDAFCRSLTYNTDPGAEEKLKTVFDKNPHPKVKATALLVLGNRQQLRRREWDLPETKYADVLSQAQQYFQRIVDDFADTPAAAQAKKELKDAEVRGIGKVTPEIAGEDIDGKEFKLSDYRGKVVLLDFWGHW
jgi:hypothetical protein